MANPKVYISALTCVSVIPEMISAKDLGFLSSSWTMFSAPDCRAYFTISSISSRERLPSARAAEMVSRINRITSGEICTGLSEGLPEEDEFGRGGGGGTGAAGIPEPPVEAGAGAGSVADS